MATTTAHDGSDVLKNRGYVVVITHVPSGKSIKFKAFISAYTETFSPDWVSEVVYGRADPIYQFKNTIRNLTLGLKIPAFSKEEAFENLAKVQRLTQFLYPNYTDVGSATTIAQSPLLRLGVMNIASNQKIAASSRAEDLENIELFNEDPASEENLILIETLTEQASSYGMTYRSIDDNTENAGLLGAMKSLTINHNLDTDAGVIELGTDDESAGNILSKLIEINFDFGVIHEHHIGWNSDGDFEAPTFPYGINMSDIDDIDL